MGVLAWLRGGRGGAASASMVGVFDEVFNPAAHRARQELEHQNERVIATPSPGDRLLETGVLRIPPAQNDTSDP